MELKDFAYEYLVSVKKLPVQHYGSDTESYYNKWKDEIIGFRPPKKGERVISWLSGKDEIASCDFEEGNCRFILRPNPKVLRRYTVTVYDAEPKFDSYVTAWPPTVGYFANPVWKKDGYANLYNSGYRRCEVEEEEV